MIRARDLAERVFWTFVAAFLTSLLGAQALLAVIEHVADVSIDVSALGAAVIAAAFAGLTAAGNVLLVIARWRLSVLPDPGAGLPGLPTGSDAGATTLEVALLTGMTTFAIALGALLLLD